MPVILSSVHHLLGHEDSLGYFTVDNRLIRVDTFPMGIDYDRFSQAIQKPKVQQQISNFKKRLPECKVILSVDRLDYTKGIPQRLGESIIVNPNDLEAVVGALVKALKMSEPEKIKRNLTTLNSDIRLVAGPMTFSKALNRLKLNKIICQRSILPIRCNMKSYKIL